MPKTSTLEKILKKSVSEHILLSSREKLVIGAICNEIDMLKEEIEDLKNDDMDGEIE